ncbi:MAG: HlyD family efflux transporter periplasmic adaptor subunit [Gammaproteobacteria bacterium]
MSAAYRKGIAAVLLALFGSALLAGCDNTQSPLPLVGTLERDRIEIPAEAWETLLEIKVSEGDQVNAGQLLAIQDPARASTRLAQAQAVLDRSRRRQAELERGPRSEDIVAARARFEGTEGQLASDQKALERTAELVRKALLSDAELDQAQARRDVSRAARDDAAALLRELIAGTTEEELDQAKAAVDEAEAVLAEQSLLASRLQLRAPVPGMIDTIAYRKGDRPPAGANVMVLLAGTAPYARVYIPQTVRAAVHAGMAARVTVDGVAGVFEGRVRSVASEASFTPYYALTERDRSRLAYVAEITLIDEAANALPTGLPVEVSFPYLPAGG